MAPSRRSIADDEPAH